jgi:predicted O-methyltransferase YrrM
VGSVLLNDNDIARRPAALAAIASDTEACGFSMASEPKTGALLAALAASKPAGKFLELGTGTGLGTSWLLFGMDSEARLQTVDSDAIVVAVARRHLGADTRVTFCVMDGADYVLQSPTGIFDFIYADAWPGKYSHLERALSLLRPGGIYFIDDMLPQANWPEGHAAKVSVLMADLERRSDFRTVRLAWASGLMLVVRTSAA